MFHLGYLCVIALAAVPVARTFLQASRDNQIAFVHRLYRDAAYPLVAVFGIICLEIGLRISFENYWFDELGQSHRFWLSIEYRVGIFLATLLLVGLFLSVNLRLLCRPLPVVPRSAPWIISFTIAGLAGFVATRLWIPLMRFFGATPTNYAASGAACVWIGGRPSSLEAASSQTWARCRKDTLPSSACASRAHLKHSSAIVRYSAAVFMKRYAFPQQDLPQVFASLSALGPTQQW